VDAVLVAGGTGGLGEAVVAVLLAADRPVVATYRRSSPCRRGRRCSRSPVPPPTSLPRPLSSRSSARWTPSIATRGCAANAILPSVIDTPANRRAQPEADFGAWVTPEVIAQTVAFLVSDASSATSGAAISVYGRA